MVRSGPSRNTHVCQTPSVPGVATFAALAALTTTLTANPAAVRNLITIAVAIAITITITITITMTSIVAARITHSL